MHSSLMTTDYATFYMAKQGDETRFYPEGNPSTRAAAFAFDERSDPPKISGFAVYDTTVATAYAVALYGNPADAKTHKPKAAPEPVTEAAKAPAEPEPEPTGSVADGVEMPEPEPETKPRRGGFRR